MLNILGHNYMTGIEAAPLLGLHPASLRRNPPVPSIIHRGQKLYAQSDVASFVEDAALRDLEVPVKPIAEYMRRMDERPPGTGVLTRDENSDWVVDRTAEEELVIERLRAKIKNCRNRRFGMIPYLDADAICCDVLKVHPMDVYGPEWFSFAPEVDEDDNEPAPALRVVA